MFLFRPYFRCKQERNQENQAVAWFLKTKKKNCCSQHEILGFLV
jgi:hypothetical protein